jgi:hypothetical protein
MDQKKRASALFFAFLSQQKHAWSGVFLKQNARFFQSFFVFFFICGAMLSRRFGFFIFPGHNAHKSARFFYSGFCPLGLCSGRNNW